MTMNSDDSLSLQIASVDNAEAQLQRCTKELREGRKKIKKLESFEEKLNDSVLQAQRVLQKEQRALAESETGHECTLAVGRLRMKREIYMRKDEPQQAETDNLETYGPFALVATMILGKEARRAWNRFSSGIKHVCDKIFSNCERNSPEFNDLIDTHIELAVLRLRNAELKQKIETMEEQNDAISAQLAEAFLDLDNTEI
eukprot:m.70515 g.70515  ORF g.70515 m.70515 type:complete len:200 (-) comp12142_c0_seq1:1892-2491(-)